MLLPQTNGLRLIEEALYYVKKNREYSPLKQANGRMHNQKQSIFLRPLNRIYNTLAHYVLTNPKLKGLIIEYILSNKYLRKLWDQFHQLCKGSSGQLDLNIQLNNPKIIKKLRQGMKNAQINAQHMHPPPQLTIQDLQLVYISTRPDALLRSILSYIEHLGIHRIVVQTNQKSFKKMTEALSTIQHKLTQLTILIDEDLLPDVDLISMNHASRNFLLRRILFSHAKVEAYFLALDDDSTLISTPPTNHFFHDKKIVGHYFFKDLTQWQSNPFTPPQDFDYAQWNSANLLDKLGCQTRGFAAHSCQLISKIDVCNIYTLLEPLGNPTLCEWAIYFNIAITLYPGRYASQPTTTLYWPENLKSWHPDVSSKEIYFKNNYGHAKQATQESTTQSDMIESEIVQYQAQLSSYLKQDKMNPSLRVLKNATNKLIAYPNHTLRLAIDRTELSQLNYTLTNNRTGHATTSSTSQHSSSQTGILITAPPEFGLYTLEIFETEKIDISIIQCELEVVELYR